jgi:signal transduction histidine kinase
MSIRTRQPETDLTLSCLVHDLNNVFQTLVEAADLLSDDPRYAAVSAAILRSIERGKSITSSIRSAEETPAAFETILDNAVSFVEDSMISGRGPRIRFIREIDPGIELRRNWAWERVLINLFSNAVRAMPQGGIIYIKAQRTDREIEIVVRDEGPGIAVEILADIFKPHVSTHGSGLGLHIVETIVKQDDGEVSAENRPDGRGAEFTIRIPAVSPGLAVPARA